MSGRRPKVAIANHWPNVASTYSIGSVQLAVLLRVARSPNITSKDLALDLDCFLEQACITLRRLLLRKLIFISSTKDFNHLIKGYTITPEGLTELSRWARIMKGLNTHE